MKDELIKLLLGLPLTVRLALLDADPAGAGWYVSRHGASMPKDFDQRGPCHVYGVDP